MNMKKQCELGENLKVSGKIVPMTTPKEDLKTCSLCGESKPYAEFYLRSKARRSLYASAYASDCKKCTQARTAAHYVKNRATISERDALAARKKRQRIKDAVFHAYGGWRCACCGETEKLFLSLDHKENDGAEFRRKIFGNRSAAGYPTYMWLYKNGFPEGFQILCMNCQHAKRMNKGICPHQVTSNDYPSTGVGSSDPKRTAPQAGEDIVSSATKVAAVIN